MESKNVTREERMMRDFDRSLRRVDSLLSSWIGDENRRRLYEASRREYDALIPRIPFLGKRNPLAVFFQSTPGYLAAYRGMQNLGYSLDDAGYLVYEIGSHAIEAIPAVGRRLIEYVWFSKWLRERLARRAADTHLRKFPGNFVIYYVEGDGETFDYGVDYLECASCKYLQMEGAFELAPYVCAVDQTASELLGWGLTRTMTLAEGSQKCDFRFSKGGETKIDLPGPLQKRLSQISC